MNKDEAIIAMKNGNKITHKSFTSEEWMTIEDGGYVFEDGCYCIPYEFWDDRRDTYWDAGWQLKRSEEDE